MLIITLISIVYYHKKKSYSLKILYCSTGFVCIVFFSYLLLRIHRKNLLQTTISSNTIEPTVTPVSEEKFIHSENTSENYQDQDEDTYDYY